MRIFFALAMLVTMSALSILAIQVTHADESAPPSSTVPVASPVKTAPVVRRKPKPKVAKVKPVLDPKACFFFGQPNQKGVSTCTQGERTGDRAVCVGTYIQNTKDGGQPEGWYRGWFFTDSGCKTRAIDAGKKPACWVLIDGSCSNDIGAVTAGKNSVCDSQSSGAFSGKTDFFYDSRCLTRSAHLDPARLIAAGSPKEVVPDSKQVQGRNAKAYVPFSGTGSGAVIGGVAPASIGSVQGSYGSVDEAKPAK
jgi:hypothetical protein